jgi:hypothetical protein
MTPRRPPSETEPRHAEAATWGPKPAAPPSEGLGRAEQIAEISREIAVRKRVYPTWVKDGRLTQERADRQIALLEAVVISLSEPKTREEDTPSGPRNMSSAQPPVIATNWRPIGKNTLVGTADVVLGRLILKGVCYHRSGDKRWVGFPAREWLDRAGQRQFSDIVGFTNPDAGRRMREAVLQAILALTGEPSGLPPDKPCRPSSSRSPDTRAGRDGRVATVSPMVCMSRTPTPRPANTRQTLPSPPSGRWAAGHRSRDPSRC